MAHPHQVLTVTNQSTKASDADVARWAQGVDLQLRGHFNPSGWVKRGLAPSASMVFVPGSATPPADAWNIIVLDNADQQGALGWHDDQSGKPYGEIFVVDSQNAGVEVSAVLSHEALEMLGDPFVDPMQPQMVQRPGTDKWYIRELCDPVQGGDYDVTLSDGSTVRVSAFCLPAWWEIQASTYRPTSNTGDVTEPWQVDARGYMSIFENGNWSQIFGVHADHRPDPDDPTGARLVPGWDARLHRVHRSIREQGIENFRPQLL